VLGDVSRIVVVVDAVVLSSGVVVVVVEREDPPRREASCRMNGDWRLFCWYQLWVAFGLKNPPGRFLACCDGCGDGDGDVVDGDDDGERWVVWVVWISSCCDDAVGMD